MFERFINNIHSQNDNQLPCPQLSYCDERMFIDGTRLRYTHRKDLLATMVARSSIEGTAQQCLSLLSGVFNDVSQTSAYAIVHNENQILKSNLISLPIELVWPTLLALCQAQLECINHSYVHIVTNRYNLNLNNKH